MSVVPARTSWTVSAPGPLTLTVTDAVAIGVALRPNGTSITETRARSDIETARVRDDKT